MIGDVLVRSREALSEVSGDGRHLPVCTEPVKGSGGLLVIKMLYTCALYL